MRLAEWWSSNLSSDRTWWNGWPTLEIDEYVRVGVSELRMFKIEVPEGAALPRYTLYDPAIGDELVIGHEALCWLVRRGYAAVRGANYPAGSWQRS
jgi:hypothetical protein